MFLYFKEYEHSSGVDAEQSVLVSNFRDGKALYSSCYFTGNGEVGYGVEISCGELEIPFWDSRIEKPDFRRKILRRENLHKEKENRKRRSVK